MSSFFTKSGFKFVLTLMIILLAGSLPGLFKGISIDLSGYFHEIRTVLTALVHPSEWVYQPQQGVSHPIFPELWGEYFYSIKILFGSIFLALVTSLLFAFLTFFLPKGLRKVVNFIVFIGESLPDLFIIIMVQLFIIWFYQRTHILLARIAGIGDHYIYGLPIICLAILPTFLFYRVIILSFEEELDKDYIDLARSKGLRLPSVLIRHVVRNLLTGIFFHSKTIIWMMLSNLLIFEYLFNIRGITMFMYEHPVPLVFTICMSLVFLPIFIFFILIQLLIQWLTGHKVVV